MRRRGERKTLLHRGLTTTMLAGSNTWALCVWCPRAASPGSTKEQVEKTPPVPQDRSINQTVRNWSSSARRPRGTRSRNAVTTAEVEFEVAGRATNNSQEEIGVANQETSTADQGQKVCKLNGLEALGNKASPRERCPRGQRRCLAQAVQAWTDSNEKTAKKVIEHSQLQAKRAYPTAGKELELLVIKHSASEKIVEIPSVVE